jgi:F0F1-type ATP synthase epsilon subunit
MKPFTAEIVTPDGMERFENVVAVHAPAEKGWLTVLAGHAPFVCLLRPGLLRIGFETGDEAAREIGRGTLTVSREGVSVLVRTAGAPRPPGAPPGSPSTSP